jgi:hypothetical protein
MNQTDAVPPQRYLKAAFALIGISAIAIFAFRYLNDRLWSDELLTTTLLQAGSLPMLWSGIAAGIDGNPPLYLTGSWLIIQALPKFVSAAAVLKLINLGLTAAAIFALCRLGRRLASSGACWIGCALFVALNDNVIFVAFELRTYALYFLMAALAVLLQQRLIERRQFRDAVMLALAYAGLTLVHTFGIAYVACIAFAGWLSQLREQQSCLRLTAGAVAPAVIVLGAWSPFLFQQLRVAKPYGWMESPGLPELLETLFASKTAMGVAILELGCIMAALIPRIRNQTFRLRAIIDDPQWQTLRYVTLVLVGITGFTLAGWVISIALFPLFVPRFFTPQMIVAFALHVAFGEMLLRLGRERRPAVIAICAIVGPLIAVNIVRGFENSAHRWPVCRDDEGRYFETSFVHGDLPVITESPHIFLPRATYADHRDAYRFPLDWEVVLNYPERARGNAVDFHIMQSLKTWKPMPSVMLTDDILGKFPQFLVIDQPGRAWFQNLMATRNVVAEKLATTGSDQSSCTLWKVTSVRARP